MFQLEEVSTLFRADRRATIRKYVKAHPVTSPTANLSALLAPDSHDRLLQPLNGCLPVLKQKAQRIMQDHNHPPQSNASLLHDNPHLPRHQHPFSAFLEDEGRQMNHSFHYRPSSDLHLFSSLSRLNNLPQDRRLPHSLMVVDLSQAQSGQAHNVLSRTTANLSPCPLV